MHSGTQGQPIRIEPPNLSAGDFLRHVGLRLPFPPIRRFDSPIHRLIGSPIQSSNCHCSMRWFTDSPSRRFADSRVRRFARPRNRRFTNLPVRRFAGSMLYRPLHRFAGPVRFGSVLSDPIRFCSVPADLVLSDSIRFAPIHGYASPPIY